MTYCLVPFELAARLHESLRSHFAGDPKVEVVVEQRGRERRRPDDRRSAGAERATERRLIRNEDGRRAGPRRAPLVSGDALPLPRKARSYADRLVFVERIEPSDEHLADIEAARLVTRFQSGDADAFAALYMRYFDRVYAYARVLFRGDDHEAEDITQQVFVRAFEALPRYEQRGRPFRSWLFTIVRNRALTELDVRGRSEPVDPDVLAEQRDGEAEEGSGATLAWLMDRELVMFVERLPLAQRQVLVLKYMLDLPAKEIAHVLGRSYVDVRMLEHRALRFLEARLVAVGRGAVQDRERPLPSYGLVQWMPVFRRRRGALHRNPGRVGIR
jgi:RNA polymerase sigma-70 factor (ECF subfamily)